jgi:membrane protein YdbS with pleckstrin-like domain
MSETKSSFINCSELFPALLTTLFVGLKLTGQIDWSWWWVLSPIWISLAFAIVVIAIAVLVAIIVENM